MIREVKTNINIKELVLGDPRKKTELQFDLKRDVGEDYWVRILGLIEQEFSFLENLDGFAQDTLIYRTSFIAPELVRDQITNPSTWDKMKSYIDKKNAVDKLFIAASMSIVSPQKAREVKLLADEDWSELEKDFNVKKKQSFGRNAAIQNVALLKLIDPEKAKAFKLDDEEWKDEKEGLRSIISDKSSISNLGFILFLSNIKLAYPERFKDFYLSEQEKIEMWAYLKSEIKEASVRDRATHIAASLILAADKIDMTPNGLQIIMPGENDESPDDPKCIPERRRF
jgi:hypothetical protein